MVKGYRFIILPAVSSIVILISSCYRGRPSEDPPIHPNQDMMYQPKYMPQSQSNFFADSATMRPSVPGTVAREELRADDAYYRGMNKDSSFVKISPVPVTLLVLKRGQERYNIYCSVCHGRVGDGKGIMVDRGYIPPPSYHTDRLRNMPDGQIFDDISNGVRNMPAYRNQIPVSDRWAIVAYLRALQRSQNAGENDVPLEQRQQLRQ